MSSTTTNPIVWEEIDPGHFVANTWTREAEIIAEMTHIGSGHYHRTFTVYVMEGMNTIVDDKTYTLEAAKTVAENNL